DVSPKSPYVVSYNLLNSPRVCDFSRICPHVFFCRTATEVALWVSSYACKARRMMKLQISMGRETPSFVPITNYNLAAVRNANQRLSEPLFIGAPTENPRLRNKTMK